MEIQKHIDSIFKGVQSIIENARNKVAVFVNTETTLLYWQIGNYINQQLVNENRAEYGAKIIATLSQQLTMQYYGKGYTYTALTRITNGPLYTLASKTRNAGRRRKSCGFIALQ